MWSRLVYRKLKSIKCGQNWSTWRWKVSRATKIGLHDAETYRVWSKLVYMTPTSIKSGQNLPTWSWKLPNVVKSVLQKVERIKVEVELFCRRWNKTDGGKIILHKAKNLHYTHLDIVSSIRVGDCPYMCVCVHVFALFWYLSCETVNVRDINTFRLWFSTNWLKCFISG